MLNRDQILAAKEPLAGRITIEEWGGEIGIRRLSAAELVDIRETAEQTDNIRSLAKLAARLIGDDDNERIFSEDDTEALIGRGYATLDKIVREGMKLNGISGQAQEITKKN